MSDGPNRKQVKDALRGIGLSSRQTDALLRAGWRGLVSAKDAEIAELEAAVEALAQRLAQKA